MARAPETDLERIDKELIKAQEQFVRANRRDDVGAEAEAFVLMETLFEQRAHLPQQRPPVE